MFSSKRASGKAVLIADVDDASVGVAIVRAPKEGPLVVLQSERKRLTIEDRTLEQRTAGVIQLLDACTDSVLKKYLASNEKHPPTIPHDIYAVVRSSWNHFKTALADEVYEKPRTVTKESLSSLAQKAVFSTSEDQMGVNIESGTLHTSVNGYMTNAPIGKKGVRLGIVVYEAGLNSQIHKGIIDTFGKYVPGRVPQIRSGVRSMISLLEDQLPGIQDYILVDVGGFQSTCVVVEKDTVSHSGAIPIGLMSIAQRLSGTGLPEEIISQLRMLGTDVCATDACRALKDLLARLEPELVKIYGDVFAAFAVKKRIPNTLVLVAPTEITPWLHAFLQRIDFAQFTQTLQPFSIELLSSYELNTRVDWAGNPADTGITTVVKYVHMLTHDSHK